MEAPAGRPESSAFSSALALGTWLATRGALVRASLAMAALGALGAIAAAVATRGTPALSSVPGVASLAFAWGAGTTLAFGCALRAIRHDREHGILALARARGVGPGTYSSGRVAGLVIVLLIAVGGGTLVAGLAATAAAGGAAPAVGRASAAALAYSLAFALTMGPVAMAALGGRTRGGAYFALLMVLVLPEVLAPWTQRLLPDGWHEVTSIPAALEAVRAGVLSAGSACLHAIRGAVALLAVVAASLLVVRARVPADAVDA